MSKVASYWSKSDACTGLACSSSVNELMPTYDLTSCNFLNGRKQVTAISAKVLIVKLE